jgi:integrase
MASVSKRTRDGKVTWWVRWRDPEGNQKSKTFTKKSEADNFRTDLETRLTRGSYVDASAGSVSILEWSEKWLEAQGHLKETTLARYRSIVNTHILTTWSKTPINKLTHADVVEWVNKLGKNQSASSVRQAHRVLSLMLAYAVRDNRLSRNVAHDVQLPKALSEEPTFLTEEELATIVKRAGSCGLSIKFLGLTGLRFGEMAALKIERVDLDKRRILVAESTTEVGGRKITSTPKNHRRRTVPIPKNLAEDLRAHIGSRKSGYVFLSPRGTQLRINNWTRDVFDPATEGFDITPRDLRHTAASLAISKGANVKAVQKMLGHQSAAMTLDVYAGLFPDDLESVAEAMDDINVPLYFRESAIRVSS